jgi:hypothetical protein
MARGPATFAILGGAFGVAIGAFAVANAETVAGDDASAPPTTFLKGNTHLHSEASGDASASLDEIAEWYSGAGYDFVIVTDHNEVTVPDAAHDVLMIPGVELTRNPGRCEPAPPEPDGGCRLHVNGLFVSPERELAWHRQRSDARVDIYQGQIDAIQAVGGVAQLNHPTWHHGVTPELLADLAERGMAFVEIANAGFPEWNAGDGEHLSTEQLWDRALSAGATVWGVASDDAHHFDPDRWERDGAYPPGGGFVMVRAERDAASIRKAMLRGDFYSSSGVVLDRVDVTDDSITLRVAGESRGRHEIRWIGDGGVVLRTDRGREATFALDDAPENATYVRAVVSDDGGRNAWIQPVRL